MPRPKFWVYLSEIRNDPELPDIVRGVFTQHTHGIAPVLVHPFHYGIDAGERQLIRSGDHAPNIIDATPLVLRSLGTQSRPIEDVIAEQDAYEERLIRYLNTAPNMPPIGFVFEAVEPESLLHQPIAGIRLPARMEYLMSKTDNPRLWIVIPTVYGRADLYQSTWEEVFHAMSELGVRVPLVGGCYHITIGGKMVDPSFIYACINHVLVEMAEFDRFTRIALDPKATYSIEMVQAKE